MKRVYFFGLLILGAAIAIALLSAEPISDFSKGMKMNAIVAGVELTRVDMPQPGPGQVLIKVMAAPINPSDVYHALGDYTVGSTGEKKRASHGTGLEGSGQVVGSGGGLLPFLYTKIGARVAFAAPDGGSWAQYAVADAMEVIPLPSDVDFDGGASAIVNPCTVIAMLKIAQAGSHKAIVHTAANSALGNMLLRAAPAYGVTIVGVVRGEKNVKALLGTGMPAENIIRSDDDSFPSKLKDAVQRTGATLAFDAVAGSMSESIASAMPSDADVYVYGLLSGREPDPGTPHAHMLKNFHLHTWLEEGGLARLVPLIVTVRSMLATELATHYKARLPMKDSLTVIRDYAKHQKGGKVVLHPNET